MPTIIYDEDSIADRSDEFATTTVSRIIETLENAPDKQYDIQMVLYSLLSQLIYAHKYLFDLPDFNLKEAIADGAKQDE